MSSLVIWSDDATGVYAEWNKQEPYSVFVPRRVVDGIAEGERTEYATAASAKRAARRKATSRALEIERMLAPLDDEQVECFRDPARVAEARGMLDDLQARVAGRVPGITESSVEALRELHIVLHPRTSRVAGADPLLPEILARTFSAVLRSRLTSEQMGQVIARNASEWNPSVCHSHDFCDASDAMAEAFRRHRLTPDVSDAASTVLWNEAWAIAKRCDFSTRITI